MSAKVFREKNKQKNILAFYTFPITLVSVAIMRADYCKILDNV